VQNTCDFDDIGNDEGNYTNHKKLHTKTANKNIIYLFESSPTLQEESSPDSTVVHTCVPGGNPVTLPEVQY